MGVLHTSLTFGVTCLLLCLPAVGKPNRLRYVLWSALFVFALNFFNDLHRVFPIIPRIPGHYNWTGKLLELVTSLVAITLLTRFDDWKWEDFGFRLYFSAGTWGDVVRFLLPILCVDTIALCFLVSAGRPSLEDHWFQLTTPGITEEIAFRGVLLGLLDRAFLGRVRVFGAELGWSAVVTSLLFGLWHGLDVGSNFAISLQIAPMVIPTLGGFVLAWCRARSGSLILAILFHSGMNEVANLIALIKTTQL
jgi:membrane protease YdiL (CAAX protease family)